MAVDLLARTDEDAGTVLLLLPVGLTWFAAELPVVPAAPARRTGRAGRAEHGEYLPHASIWPLGVGIAAFLMANGLILGGWFLVPGGVLLLLSVAGLVHAVPPPPHLTHPRPFSERLSSPSGRSRLR